MILENINVNVSFSSEINKYASSGSISAINHGIIDKCWVKGNITNNISFNVNSGGICGSNGAEITNCISQVNIYNYLNNNKITDYRIGGISGANEKDGKIENSYNCGNDNIMSNSSTSSTGYVGGIAGLNLNKVNNVYSIGKIIRSEKLNNFYLGGTIGKSNTNQNKNLYYLEEIFNVTEQDKVFNEETMLTKNELKDTKLIEILNKNNSGIWKEDKNNINEGYPILFWQ